VEKDDENREKGERKEEVFVDSCFFDLLKAYNVFVGFKKTSNDLIDIRAINNKITL